MFLSRFDMSRRFFMIWENSRIVFISGVFGKGVHIDKQHELRVADAESHSSAMLRRDAMGSRGLESMGGFVPREGLELTRGQLAPVRSASAVRPVLGASQSSSQPERVA